MKWLFRLLVPITALAGVLLYYLSEDKNLALFLFWVLVPVFSIYILLSVKNSTFEQGSRIGRTLMISATLNVLSIFLVILFKTQHYPGANFFRLLTIFTSIVNLIVGLAYFVSNRKQLSNQTVHLLILILFPSFLFFWQYAPQQAPYKSKVEYRELVSQAIKQLSQNNTLLYPLQDNDSTLHALKNIKRQIITNTGGLTEEGDILGFYSKSFIYELKNTQDFFNNLDVNKNLKHDLFSSRTTGDAIWILTQIEQDWIIRTYHSGPQPVLDFSNRLPTIRSLITGPASIEQFTEVKFKNCDFNLVTGKNGDTTYFATSDSDFIIDKNIHVWTKFKDLPQSYKENVRTVGGWGYTIDITDNWRLGFCEGASCTSNQLTDSSEVKWIFRREGF